MRPTERIEQAVSLISKKILDYADYPLQGSRLGSLSELLELLEIEDFPALYIALIELRQTKIGQVAYDGVTEWINAARGSASSMEDYYENEVRAEARDDSPPILLLDETIQAVKALEEQKYQVLQNQHLEMFIAWLSERTAQDPLLLITIKGDYTECFGSGDEEEQNCSPFENTIAIHFEHLYCIKKKLAFIAGHLIGSSESEQNFIVIPFSYYVNNIVRPKEYGYFYDFQIVMIRHHQELSFKKPEFLIHRTYGQSYSACLLGDRPYFIGQTARDMIGVLQAESVLTRCYRQLNCQVIPVDQE